MEVFMLLGEIYYENLLNNNLKIKVDFSKIDKKFIEYIENYSFKSPRIVGDSSDSPDSPFIYLFTSVSRDSEVGEEHYKRYFDFINKYNNKICFYSIESPMLFSLENILPKDKVIIKYSPNFFRPNNIIDEFDNIEINPSTLSKEELQTALQICKTKYIHLAAYKKSLSKLVRTVTITNWYNALKYKTIFVLKNGSILNYKPTEFDVIRTYDVQYICDKYGIDSEELIMLKKDDLLRYTLAVFRELSHKFENHSQSLPNTQSLPNLSQDMVADTIETIPTQKVFMQSCSVCNLSNTCSYAYKQEGCVFNKELAEIENINDPESFQNAIFKILNLQLKRINKGLIQENMSGNMLTETLSREMQSFMRMASDVHKMSKKPESEVIIKGKMAEEPSLLKEFFGK